MRKESKNFSLWQRFGALALAAVLVFGMLPNISFADIGSNRINDAEAVTKADPATLTRPQEIYGNNTLNAGKVTVGKSVSNSSVTVNGQTVNLSDPDNFLITISQAAQVMGMSSETSVPVDVVFVLDTSGSMNQNGVDRASSMVTAANSAIKTLMQTNEQNRVAVVAFSSEGYGGGTSGNKAASVLSSLAHYKDDAATNHLQWVDDEGTVDNNGEYIAGRDQATITVTEREWVEDDDSSFGGYYEETEYKLSVNAFRNGHDGGTNIQAGIVAGANILTNVQDKTWTNPETNETVTRIPFLIILSDGQPTFSYNDEEWYAPDASSAEQGPGSGAYEGNGFIAALTAAYYKGKITEHYYGDSANADNHCFVYTMGVQIDSLSGDNKSLAQITLDPAAYTTGNYATANARSYWNYGNTADNNSRDSDYGWKTYWANYLTGGNFNIRVNYNDNNRDVNYTVTAESIAASKDYVDSLAYNDDYFAADDVEDMEAIFEALIAEIQKKAITVPTKVTTGDHDFDGYVTFTDPLGEYMELKSMKGIIADGYFYQGKSAADGLADYGTSDADPTFDAMIQKVLKTRLGLTNSDDRFTTDDALNDFIDSLIATKKDNTITWWGNEYTSGYEKQVQVLAPAANDTIEYIEEQRAAGKMPTDADYVCRSYFFYGAAGGANPTPNTEYLAFVVRVQRSVHAPYQQTVVISAPASLLSVEKVMVNETFDNNGNPRYTVSVEKANPARVVYEVGLWDSITPETVSSIVSDAYAKETVTGAGQANVTTNADGKKVYHFFTNDWDRKAAQDSHHRPMAKATFDAAADNAFYTYQENTLIVDAAGNAVTSNPAGTTAYYVRTYYDWDGASKNADGTYNATKKTERIPVDIPSNANLVNEGGKWYIPKGAYTASTLVVNGDDVYKDNPETPAERDGNVTNTSVIVAHPHRTDDDNHYNSHYTVYLGNNGVLSLVSDPPEPTKTVSIYGTDGQIRIEDANGNPVMVDETLTYTIKAKNTTPNTGTITITDTIPEGTVFKSADPAVTSNENGKLTWTFTNVAPGAEVTAKFSVEVTKAALDITVGSIQNQATATIGDNEYKTNIVSNPPEGKKVTTTGTTGTVKVGDRLTYSIEFHNDAKDSTGKFVDSTVTIRDYIPAGTTFISADHQQHLKMNGDSPLWSDSNGTYIQWEVPTKANMGGVVTFVVEVNASAQTPITNGATIQVGGRNPSTNTTSTELAKGNLKLSKVLAQDDTATQPFTLTLTDATGKLSGDYTVTGSSLATKISFTNGVGEIQIKADELITIENLPAGVELTVVETKADGWTPTYSSGTVEVTAGEEKLVTVTNDYYAVPVKFQLQGIKTFSGSFPAGKTFTFRAQEYDYDEAKVVPNGIVVTANATSPENASTAAILFSERTFASAFDRYYLITEIDPHFSGITTSDAQYLLHLDVDDNGKGNMVLTATLYTEGTNGGWVAGTPVSNVDNAGNVTGTTITLGGVNFTNTYKAASVDVVISGTKSLTGRYLKANDFSFQLIEGTSVIATATNGDGTQANPSVGSFSFPKITYTAEDLGGAAQKTFTYYIREVTSSPAANTKYDYTYYEVKVTVTDDGSGQLKATQTITKYVTTDGTTYDNGTTVDSIVYSNEFTPADTAVTLTGTKTLTGAGVDSRTTYPFSFSVYKSDATGAKGSLVTVGSANVTGASTSNITFGKIGITPADMTASTTTFYFLVEEDRLDADPNMYYDPAQFLASVEVTYNPNGGTLTPGAVTYQIKSGDTWVVAQNGIAYHNTRDYITVTPVGTKVTTGTALPEGLRFSFRVTDANGKLAGTGMSQATTAGTSSNNSIEFTSLVITEEMFVAAEKDSNGYATFVYYIQESNTASTNGITYDTDKFAYEVKVERNSDNELQKVANSEKYYLVNADGSWTEMAMLFENTYAAAGYINLTAHKSTSGTYELKPDDFDFRLQRLNQDGTLVSGSAVNGTNDQNGNVTFATLNFSNGMLASMEYHAAENENAEYWLVRYLMTEIKPDTGAIPGISYDTTPYIVTLKITKNTTNTDTLDVIVYSVSEAQAVNGVYSAKENTGKDLTTATAANNTCVTFTNTYSVQQGAEVTIQATKTLTGRELSAGEFGFNLSRYDATSREWKNVGTAFNDASGNISFTRHYNASTLSHLAVTENGNEYTVRYRLEEVQNNLGGIAYSGNVFYVDVVILHNEGTASYTIKSVTYYTIGEDNAETVIYAVTYNADGTVAGSTGDADAVVFANRYDTNDVHFTPEASKVLLGADLNNPLNPAGFSFQVVETDANGVKIPVDANQGIYKVVSTGTSDANGKVTFSNVHYGNETGTRSHYYVIEEVYGTDATITYSNSKYYVKVDIHDNGLGVLKIQSITYYRSPVEGEYLFSDDTIITTDNVKFTNHYGPGTIDLNLDIDKAFQTESGSKYIYNLKGSEFDFQVFDNEACTGDPVTVGTNAASDTGVADIIFGTIEITKGQLIDEHGQCVNEKTFTYYIKEVNRPGAASYIGIDPTVIKVEVTVTDDGYGNLTPNYKYLVKDNEGNYTVELTGSNRKFTNTYKPKPVDVSLEVIKHLEGKDLNGEQFTFVLSDGTNEIGTWTNDASGKAVISLSYAAADMSGATYANGVYTKVFTYTLSEKANTVSNNNGEYTYDGTIYTVTVTLTDDGSGQLRASVVVTDANSNVVNPVVFKNTYDPTDVSLNLSTAVNATKTIVDDEGNVLIRPNVTFNFKVTDLTGKEVATGTVNGSGKITFTPELTYSAPGEYRYLLTEVAETKTGYVMDTNTWCIHVQVTYDSASGELAVNQNVYKHLLVDGHADDGIVAQSSVDPEFINVYDAKDVHLTLTAKKTMTGDRTTVKENEFIFQLLNSDGTIAAQARNDANGNVTFYLDYDLQDLNGKTEREYEYTVKEIVPQGVDNGITYDTSTYTVTVTLKDNGNGTLSAIVGSTEVVGTGSVGTGIVFENEYTADDVTVTFHAIKRMEGMPLEDGIYSFQLKDGDDILAEGTNKADGTITFNKDLTFTKPGTYTYTMVEYKGSKPGVTFDATSFKVTVEVTDNGMGNLEAKVIYSTEEGIYDLPVFINIYKPAGVSVTVEAKKELNGREMKAEAFTFQILDGEGNVVSEAKNKADGTVTFDSQYFEEVGTHTYTIVEVIPTDAVKNEDGTYTLNGVTYDQTIYTVVIEITDPDYDGTLDKKVTYYLGTEAVDAAKVLFKNTYTTTDSNEIVIDGTKVLENKDLEKETFQFQLKDSDGKVLQTITNAADGKFAFDALKYTFADMAGKTEQVFTYTVVEVQGTLGGVTYDKTVYTVKVTVTDNGDGTLTAAAVISGGKNDGKILFTNIYNADAATVDVTAKKELTGKPLTAGEFNFVLVNKANKDDSFAATNAADGTILFDKLSFSAAGTYVYELYEVKGTDKHYTYDDKVITVTITVTDNGDGTMTAKAAYSEPAVFQNIYTPDAITVVLEGTKELTGRDLVAGEFEFEVRDPDGHRVTTGTNKADGTIVFENIVIDTVMDLTLYVTEVKGNDKQVEYDDYTYRVELVVTNENGVFKAAVNYLDGDIVFYNEYEIPETPPTGDDTPVYLYAGLMGISAVALLAMLVLGRKKKERKHF